MENLIFFCNMIWNNSVLDIPAMYLNKNLNELLGEEIKPIVETVKAWDFKNPLVCSIISVMNGIGKSHLASGLLRQFVKNYVTVNYETINKGYEEYEHKEYFEFKKFYLGFVPERIILREIRDTYKDKYKTEQSIFDKYCKYDLLVIDDIFSNNEKDKEFQRRVILDLVNDRCEYKMKPTILTSNLSLNELANIDTRIASRINNKMLIEIKTKLKDFRN
jgi:DNA replication protein DnaC